LASAAPPLVLSIDIAYRASRTGAHQLSKIDLTIVWDDAKTMGAVNRDLLTAIAGMFVLLPGVVAEQFMTLPEKLEGEVDNHQLIARLAQYGADNWLVLLVHSVVTAFGVMALQSLLLRSERLTVRESLHAAMPILPAYLLANILQGLGVMTGLLLFLVPGFYLLGRFALVAPVVAAERLTSPLAILRRSAELTHGNGWRVFGLLAIIFMTMMVIAMVLTSLTGVVGELLLPPDAAALALTIVSSLVETGMTLTVVLVTAALYRAATAPRAAAWQSGRGR
jgi:hypothetical protein